MHAHACRRTVRASLRKHTASGVPSAPATCTQATCAQCTPLAVACCLQWLAGGEDTDIWRHRRMYRRTSHVVNTERFQMSGERWSDTLCEGYADAAVGPCSLHTPTARRRSCEKAVQSACASHAAEHHGSVTCDQPLQPAARARGRCKVLPSTEAEVAASRAAASAHP